MFYINCVVRGNVISPRFDLIFVRNGILYGYLDYAGEVDDLFDLCVEINGRAAVDMSKAIIELSRRYAQLRIIFEYCDSLNRKYPNLMEYMTRNAFQMFLNILNQTSVECMIHVYISSKYIVSEFIPMKNNIMFRIRFDSVVQDMKYENLKYVMFEIDKKYSCENYCNKYYHKLSYFDYMKLFNSTYVYDIKILYYIYKCLMNNTYVQCSYITQSLVFYNISEYLYKNNNDCYKLESVYDLYKDNNGLYKSNGLCDFWSTKIDKNACLIFGICLFNMKSFDPVEIKDYTVIFDKKSRGLVIDRLKCFFEANNIVTDESIFDINNGFANIGGYNWCFDESKIKVENEASKELNHNKSHGIFIIINLVILLCVCVSLYFGLKYLYERRFFEQDKIVNVMSDITDNTITDVNYIDDLVLT